MTFNTNKCLTDFQTNGSAECLRSCITQGGFTGWICLGKLYFLNQWEWKTIPV